MTAEAVLQSVGTSVVAEVDTLVVAAVTGAALQNGIRIDAADTTASLCTRLDVSSMVPWLDRYSCFEDRCVFEPIDRL